MTAAICQCEEPEAMNNTPRPQDLANQPTVNFRVGRKTD